MAVSARLSSAGADGRVLRRECRSHSALEEPVLEARVRVQVRGNAAVVDVDVDGGKVLMVDECGFGDGSGNGDGDGTRDGRYGVQARQARTPRPSPRMMQSWHLLSLILIGLRCGGFIIRVQDFSLQPADVRGRTRTRLVPAMTQ